MNPEELDQIAETEHQAQSRFAHKVNVCVAAGCLSCQSQTVKDALDKEIDARGWQGRCKVKGVGCMGLCAEGPLVSTTTGTMYQHVGPSDAGDILDSFEGPLVERLHCRTDIPFFQHRKKLCWKTRGSSRRSGSKTTSPPRATRR